MKRVIDIATCPIESVEQFIDTPRPRKGTKDEAKQEAQVAEKLAERVSSACLDLDLCRLSAVGYLSRPDEADVQIMTCQTEDVEKTALVLMADFFKSSDNAAITYFGNNFDLQVLQRRARWLGVPFPIINTDRYRSPHHDLGELLSDRNPDRRRSLGFYVKRHGWSDLQKPLDGAREAQVHQTGEWDLLADSVRHDVVATARLASWLKVW